MANGNTLLTLIVNNGETVVTYAGDYLFIIDKALQAAREGSGFRLVQYTDYLTHCVTRTRDYVGHTLVKAEDKGEDYENTESEI